MTDLMKTAAQALTRRGFEVQCVPTAKEAAEAVLSLIPDGSSVGAGGSVTIDQLHLVDALRAKGCSVIWHWLEPRTEELCRRAHAADVYLTSSNAVTSAGQLVNIDGTGNRVAAMIHGPRMVVFVIGRNKLVEGGYGAAIARVKREACPPNARRLGLDTPCAVTGQCDERSCQHSICNAIGILEHPTGKRRMAVILVDEALGY